MVDEELRSHLYLSQHFDERLVEFEMFKYDPVFLVNVEQPVRL